MEYGAAHVRYTDLLRYVDRNDVGALMMRTESLDATSTSRAVPANNYMVGRYKRNLLRTSWLGATVTDRESSTPGDYNRVYGSDAIFTFARHFTTDAFFAKSDQPGKATWAWSANAKWDSDFFLLGMEYLSIDPNFRSDMAFIRRADYHRFGPQIAFRPRPKNNKVIRQLIFRYRTDYTMNTKNVLQTRVSHTAFEMRLQNGDLFGWVPHTRFDTFSAPFTNRAGVWLIPPGSYSWWNNGLRYTLNPSRRISGQAINWAWHIGYYGGGTLHDKIGRAHV